MQPSDYPHGIVRPEVAGEFDLTAFLEDCTGTAFATLLIASPVTVSRHAQLHTVFGQIMETFDAGLLEAYRAVDASAPYSRQCIVQDVHYLRTELAKLHLSLPSGYCPKLVAYAQGLPLS